MKLQLLFAICFSPLFVFGQDYIPLLQKENQWNTIEEVVNRNNVTSRDYNQYVYKLQKDTLINGIIYNTLVESTDSLQTWAVVGFVRENIKERKVYSWLNNKDFLLYDFTIEANDPILFPDTDFQSIVTKVEYIEIDGIKRKTIHYTDEDGREDYWIEGIGCNWIGLLRTYKRHTEEELFFYYNSLIRNEELIYVDQSLLFFFTDFWGVKDQPEQLPYPPEPIDPPVGNEVPLTSDISFHITPGKLTIESPEISSTHVFDLSGSLLDASIKKSTHFFSLSSGIYLVKVDEKTYKVVIK